MDYLSRGFKSVLGGQADGSTEGPSGAETVSFINQKLCKLFRVYIIFVKSMIWFD